MSLVSLGDMAQSFLLRRQSATLKTEMVQLSTELTTGRVTDVAKRVSGDLGLLASIDVSLARLKSMNVANQESTIFASAMQSVLAGIDENAGNLSASLIAAATAGAAQQIQAVGVQGLAQFKSAVSQLNTEFGGRSLFAGNQTNAPALHDAEQILTAVESAVAAAGATTAVDVAAAVSQWFDDPNGFGAVGYAGGAKTAAFSISQTETAEIGITAEDPTIIETLKVFAMSALLSRGVLNGQTGARQDLAQLAGLALLEGQQSRTYLAAQLGVVEAQIEKASVRNAEELSTLSIKRNQVLEVDPYEAASKLQETQLQLEKIYAITARMQRLNLADYLR